MLNIEMTRINGRINCWRDIPEDLMAVSSRFSPRLPKVMIEESKTARGNAKGTRVAEAYSNNSRIISKSNPLPARSSMRFHRNCIISMNKATKKVATRGLENSLSSNLCNRFNRLSYHLLLQNAHKNKLFFRDPSTGWGKIRKPPGPALGWIFECPIAQWYRLFLPGERNL